MKAWYKKMSDGQKRQRNLAANPQKAQTADPRTAPVKKFPDVQALLHAAVPALLYTALSNAVYSLLRSVQPKMSGILPQGIALAVCLAYFVWRAVQEGVFYTAGQTKGIYRYPAAFCYTASVVLCGIACNYLIYFTGLKTVSQGYRHVSEIFYGNGLWLEIFVLCVLGPAAEELVYRGFVLRRLRAETSDHVAVLLSALLFGFFHLNLVQGVYGFVLGLLLAVIVCKTGSIATAAAAHMASNLTSVLWTETELLKFLNQQGKGIAAAAVFCLLLTGIFAGYGNRMVSRDGKRKTGKAN